MLSPATVAAVIADYTQTPLLKSEDLDTGQVPISWVDLRPTGTAAVPVFADENNITVAISYPQAEEVIAYMHQLYTDYKKHRITEVIADRIVRQTVFRLFQRDEEDIKKLQEYIHEVEALSPQSPQTEAKLNQVIVAIINTAVTLGASDIQLLATATFGQVQYKLEGTGHIVGEMTRDLYLRVMRKMMADLNVSPIPSGTNPPKRLFPPRHTAVCRRKLFAFIIFVANLPCRNPKNRITRW